MMNEELSEGDSSALLPDEPEKPVQKNSKMRWVGFEADEMFDNISRSTTKRRYKRWYRKMRKAMKNYWTGVMARTIDAGMIGSSYGGVFFESARAPGAIGPVVEPDFRSDFEKWEDKHSHLLKGSNG